MSSGSSNISNTGATIVSGGTNSGLTLSQANTNLILSNANTVGGTLILNPVITSTSGGDIIYNGQVYHGQDAVNLINSLQHPVTVNTTP